MINTLEYEDKALIEKSLELLQSDDFCLFCIVVKTWGSSPRPIGSLMVISQNGDFYGSVSGGCVEDDLREKYLCGNWQYDRPFTVLYDGKKSGNQGVHIPCGSELTIVVEKVTNRDELIEISTAMSHGKMVSRHLNMESGAVSLKSSLPNENDFYFDEYLLKKNYGTSWSILVVGANHVAAYVINMGNMLGFKMVLCEPREDYLNSFIEDGYEMTTLMPDDAVNKYANNVNSIVLCLSHDPKLDDMALVTALEMDIFYVGVIGSMKNAQSRTKRLLELGLSKHSVDKCHGPVGLDIKSKTPAEISVSIFAELIELKNTSYKH